MTRLHRALLLIAALASFSAAAESHVCCADHQGIDKPYRSGYGAVCADGFLDRLCTPKHLTAKVLKLKQTSTERGQILAPGEKAPTTTMKESHLPPVVIVSTTTVVTPSVPAIQTSTK